MKREVLTDILREACVAAGYAFYTGPVHRAGGEVRAYPAAWLEPPVMKSSEGRGEGTLTYRITLHLMALPQAGGQDGMMAALETDALAVTGMAGGDDRVCGVSAVSCVPAAQTLTAHGEMSVELSCEAVMWYYL